MNRISERWWMDFLSQTKNLSTPFLSKGSIIGELDNLSAIAKEVIEQVTLNHPGPALRVWMENKQLTKEETINYLVTPSKEEHLFDWFNSHYKRRETGIILNGCQNYSKRLKEYMTSNLDPLLKFNGVPTKGLDVTIFMGNYDHTPIGFHIDPIGHKVIHFHIGPDAKEMYLVRPEIYLEKLGQSKEPNLSIDELKGCADLYLIEPGDLFFMPQGLYHIGRNIGFSIGITVWHMDMSVNYLSNLLTRTLFTFDETGDKTISTDSYGSNSVKEQLQSFESILPVDFKDLTLMEIMSKILTDKKLLLRSNDNFVPFGQRSIKLEHKITINNLIQGTNSTKILYTSSQNSIDFYVQGQKFRFPFHTKLPEVIERINTLEKVYVNDLVEPLRIEWDDEVCLAFLTEIYMRGGIQVLS